MGVWDRMKGPKPLNLGRWTRNRRDSGSRCDEDKAVGKVCYRREETKKFSDDVRDRTAGVGKSFGCPICCTVVKGRIGEDVALECLLQRGLKLLERNWRCGHKELDLIMHGSDGLHFVEVRSRGLGMLQTPLQTVGSGKRHRIVSAADAYVRMTKCSADVHFDIVAVYCDDVTGEVMYTEYFPDAFIAV